jgi:nucleoside-diphosphate-sugar epimerase
MTDNRRPARQPSELVAETLRGGDEVIAVTGATGWFGAVAMDMLYGALGDEAEERVVGYASRERELVVADGRVATARPLEDLVTQDASPTTLLHFAFVPRDQIAVLGVDAYVAQNVAMTTTVLDAIARHKPRHVVVTSSGAARSSTGQWQADLAHHPYGTLKRLDELAFRAATQEVGGCCVIPRVFSVGGDRLARPDVYALASMIAMAEAGGPIDVLARGPVYRTYCGVDEVVALSLWAAVSGHDVVFDTCGAVVEVGELACVVAREHGIGEGAVRRTWDVEAVADRYVGKGLLMQELAASATLHLRPLDALVRASSGSLRTERHALS